MSHWVSNRGKLLHMQGAWDDDASTLFRLGLLVNTSSAVPAAVDTEAEIQDIATVTALLALTGVDEPTGGWYARANLSRTNWAQDDTNNRANAVAADVTFTGATVTGAETHIYGAFVYEASTDTNDTTRQFVSLIIFSPIIALNGSNILVDISDLFRAA